MEIPANKMRGRFFSIPPPNRGPGSNSESEDGVTGIPVTVDHTALAAPGPCLTLRVAPKISSLRASRKLSEVTGNPVSLHELWVSGLATPHVFQHPESPALRMPPASLCVMAAEDVDMLALLVI